MSITGPGCDKCNHTGMVLMHPDHPMSLVPCLACSPWTQERDSGGVAVTDPAAHDSPSERDVEPLDLDAIEARCRVAARECSAGCDAEVWASACDVPALVAEVRRLRDELAAQETSTGHLGDLMRATVNALRGALAMRKERDALRARLATTPPDDPEADGTDAAHPAWWRGNDAGCKGAMSLIARLRAYNDALRARVAELERLAAGPATMESVAMTPADIETWGRALG